MIISAKLKVNSVLDNGTVEKINLSPVAATEDPNSENSRYATAVPAGNVDLTFASDQLKKQLIPGKSYYVTFNEVAE